MRKKFSYLIFGILFFFAFQGAEEVWAGAEHNVWGFAWSENIGWISFNSTNCDTNNDGFSDGTSGCPAAGTPIANYGVNINSGSGEFSGYAWSENIGWISFNAADLSGCPDSPCKAWVDLSCPGNQCPVYGWARVLSHNGDWPGGWIRLRDENYGVWIDPTLTPAEFKGWAWSDLNIGWISFNCENQGTCGTSDYKVLTSLGFNFPPEAKIECDPSDCTVYAGDILTLINQSTDPNGQDDISKSEWDILGWGGDPDLSCSGICNFTPQTLILGSGDYTAELYIEDKGGLSDTATKDFTVKEDATAGFMCSMDNSTWQACEELSPTIGETIYLKDDPSLSEHSEPSEGATIVSRIWKVNGMVFSSDNDNNPSLTLNDSSNEIELTITDSAGRTASVSHTVLGVLPLPEWREIKPF